MTRASLREYAAVQGERYRQSTRAEKRQFLDEGVAVTGIHREAAIRCSAVRRGRGPRRDPRAARASVGTLSLESTRAEGEP